MASKKSTKHLIELDKDEKKIVKNQVKIMKKSCADCMVSIESAVKQIIRESAKKNAN